MALTLTEVAVEVHADLKRLKPEVVAGAAAAGAAAGDVLGDGIVRGADGKLRDDKGRFVAGGDGAAKKFSKGFQSGIDGTFAKVAAVMASKFALIGGAAAAAAPGIIHLTAALLPAAGAALALPAALIGIKAASSVVKIAVLGVGDAITAGFGNNAKAASAALNQLSGNARNFAGQIIGLRPQVLGLKDIISDRFFLPLLNDVRPLAQLYLPMLKANVGNLAGPLGGLAEQLAKSARSGLVFGTVTQVLQQTRLSVMNMRGAIDPLVQTLAILVKDTVGELPKMASGFAAAAARLREFVAGASQQGQITAAFRAGVAVIGDLGAILRNVGSIILSVFQSATASGSSLLGNLRQLTGQAAAFLNSAKGSGALVSLFGTLNSLGAALRTSLAAVLPAIASSIQALAPALAGLAGPASQIVVALAPLLPLVAGIAATVITRLTPAIASLANFLSQNATAVKVLAGAMVGYVAIMKVAAVITGVQAAGSMLAYIKATQIGAAVTKALSAAQIVLGAAMRFALGPIGLVISAVALLVAGVVYAYKNHEGFRTLVQNVWKAIQVAVSATVNWIKNVAWPLLSGAFKGIAAVAKVAFAVIQLAAAIATAYFRNVVAPMFMWLWKNVIVPVFNGIKNTIVNTWNNSIKPVLAIVGSFITNTVAPAFRAGVAAIAKAWNGLRQAAMTPVRFVVNGVINPLIGGFNRVAKIFGTREIDPIRGFAKGGRIPGPDSGGRDNMLAAVFDAGRAQGVLRIGTGEFVVNTDSTKENEPVLNAINSKRGKVTHADIDPYLDGYRRGGRVGQGDGIGDFFGKIKSGLSGAADFITNPSKVLTGVANAALSRIPGGGALTGLLKGMGSKLIAGIGKWLEGNAGGALGGGNGPEGWRQKRAIIAQWFPGLGMISGPRPGATTLSGNRSLHADGLAVDYPAVRALAARIRATFGKSTQELITPWNDLNILRGRPHRYTGAVWNQHNFSGGNAHVHWGAAAGGRVGRDSGVPLFDRGGTLAPGLNTVYNGLGKPENLVRSDAGGEVHIHIHIHDSVILNEKNAEDLVVAGYRAAKRHKKLP